VVINPCAAQQLAAAIDELLSRGTEVCDDRLADLAV
jgi:hypothetical protein